MKVVTNYHWRDLTCLDIAKLNHPNDDFSDLDWANDYETVFKYRGQWYALSEFMRVTSNHPLHGTIWHRFMSDSFFSGTAVELGPDDDPDHCDQIRVALVLS